jgi:hypothetical protein
MFQTDLAVQVLKMHADTHHSEDAAECVWSACRTAAALGDLAIAVERRKGERRNTGRKPSPPSSRPHNYTPVATASSGSCIHFKREPGNVYTLCGLEGARALTPAEEHKPMCSTCRELRD